MKTPTASSLPKKQTTFSSFMLSKSPPTTLRNFHYTNSFIHSHTLDNSKKQNIKNTQKSINDTTSATSIALKLSNIIPVSTRILDRKNIPLIAVQMPQSVKHQHLLSQNEQKVFFNKFTQF